jgi:Mrp family chromosome partitioning ATPase
MLVVGSPNRAPGASTMGLGVARHRAGGGHRCLLVEADPSGGCLAARLGAPAAPGLVQVAAAARNAEPVQALGAGRRGLTAGLDVVCAPPAAAQSVAALSALGAGFADALAGSDDEVVVDVGRISADGPAAPFVRSASLTLIAARPQLAELAAAGPLLAELAAAGRLVGLVLIEAGPQAAEPRVEPAEAFAAVAGQAALTAVLPHDPTGVRTLYTAAGTDRLARRRPLARALADLAGRASLLAGEAPAGTADQRSGSPARTIDHAEQVRA